MVWFRYMPSYEELQEQAKGLGLKYVGVSKKDLIASIEKAQSANQDPKQQPEDKSTSTPPQELNERPATSDTHEGVGSAEDLSSRETGQDPKQQLVVVAANVRKGGKIIRQYTLKDHGERFVELAQTFATKFAAEVEEVY